MVDVIVNCGMAFPVEIGRTGGLREAAGIAKIEQSIRIVLGTQWGQRLMRPNFGCNLKSLVFAPNDEGTASLAKHYVEDGLCRWEPRIDLLDVEVENDIGDAALGITIHYRVKATGQAESLIYSLSLEQP